MRPVRIVSGAGGRTGLGLRLFQIKSKCLKKIKIIDPNIYFIVQLQQAIYNNLFTTILFNYNTFNI